MRGNVTGMIAVLVATAVLSARSAAQDAAPPRGQDLKKLVVRYMAADDDERARIREECDEKYAPLKAGSSLKALRKSMLKYASRTGPKIGTKGRNWFYQEDGEKRGKYIVRGYPNKTLFLGLHGGGVGSGAAESAASGMGGGGWWWIFPEVLHKTGRGWTSDGTEEFVIELIRAAKRTGKVDPDRIYISGHSMGGYGSWTIGAHHADVFAGGAPYAGAPGPIYEGDYENQKVVGIEPGVLPNLYNMRFHIFQSLDDRQVRPAPNIYAAKRLAELRGEHPGGFDFKYVQVDDRGHAAPKEGYLPSQRWLTKKRRDARPRKFLWEPVLAWKRHFYWLYLYEVETDVIIQAQVDGKNVVRIESVGGTAEFSKAAVLLGEPLVDLKKEVTIHVDGKKRFSGKVERTLSTLLLTLPRHDDKLLFDARVDLQ